MIEQISPEGADGHCELCGKKSGHLKQIASLGCDVWICQDCERKVRERIRHRYLVAGEHTEPAE